MDFIVITLSNKRKKKKNNVRCTYVPFLIYSFAIKENLKHAGIYSFAKMFNLNNWTKGKYNMKTT